jgi:hypothetical protein
MRIILIPGEKEGPFLLEKIFIPGSLIMAYGWKWQLQRKLSPASSSRLDSQFFNIPESPAVLPCYFPTLLIQQNIIFPGEAGGERERESLSGEMLYWRGILKRIKKERER